MVKITNVLEALDIKKELDIRESFPRTREDSEKADG